MPHLVATLIYLSQIYSHYIRGDRSPLSKQFSLIRDTQGGKSGSARVDGAVLSVDSWGPSAGGGGGVGLSLTPSGGNWPSLAQRYGREKTAVRRWTCRKKSMKLYMGGGRWEVGRHPLLSGIQSLNY